MTEVYIYYVLMQHPAVDNEIISSKKYLFSHAYYINTLSTHTGTRDFCIIWHLLIPGTEDLSLQLFFSHTQNSSHRPVLRYVCVPKQSVTKITN